MFGRNTGKPLKGPTMGAHTIQCTVWTHEFLKSLLHFISSILPSVILKQQFAKYPKIPIIQTV